MNVHIPIPAEPPTSAGIGWGEAACLIHLPVGETDVTRRTIIAEGTFAEIMDAFAHYRADQWPRLTIAFPERRIPPFRFDEGDFAAHVVSRMWARPG
jgi:hypothetical protein